ncbi:MAG: YbaB/EbfC family nucleoid-associated protein [Chlamydiae bacterium]|nr:YbaB/EbfC family nucleoid-associated protein [Chlamydiota bacterium]
MGSGFSKLKKQRKQFEEQLSKIQAELDESEFHGTAGNGLVKVVLTGQKELKSLQIQPECVDKDDIEGLQDLIVAAFKDASEKLEKSAPMNNMASLF